MLTFTLIYLFLFDLCFPITYLALVFHNLLAKYGPCFDLFMRWAGNRSITESLPELFIQKVRQDLLGAQLSSTPSNSGQLSLTQPNSAKLNSFQLS